MESMGMIGDGPVGLGTRFRAKWHTSPPVVTECMLLEHSAGRTL